MPIKNHTEIVAILDRSGSMLKIVDDSVGGFNAFIEEQKKVAGTASLTTILFDDEYEKIYENKNLNEVEPMTTEIYKPRGWTALLDAIGKTINDVGIRLSNTPEDQRPEKVMVCILTDGDENDSKEFTNDKIKEMINHQRDVYKWEFCFLGANIDSFAVAGSFGIHSNYTCNFVANAVGVNNAYRSISKMSTSYRTGNN